MKSFPVILFTSLICLGPLVAEDAYRQQIETDLKLELDTKGRTSFRPGEWAQFPITLRNTSKETVYHVVRQGDGSEEGWREPHVYFTATIDTGDGHFRPVPHKVVMRCGNYAADWEKDVVALQPGGTLQLCSPPLDMFEFPKGGQMKLVAHYDYRAGRTRTDGPMSKLPSFSITSSPVEITITTPLAVVLSVKEPLIAGRENLLSRIFSVDLTNHTLNTLEVASPALKSPTRLTLEFNLDGTRDWGRFTTEKDSQGHAIQLGSGASAGMLGDGPLSNGLEGAWICPPAKKVQARAIYTTQLSGKSYTAVSEWVELQIKPAQ